MELLLSMLTPWNPTRKREKTSACSLGRSRGGGGVGVRGEGKGEEQLQSQTAEHGTIAARFDGTR